MLSDLLTKPCTITRRSPSTTKDDYGNVIPATSTVTTVCELQQLPRRADAEAASHDDLSDTQWLLVLPPGAAIDTSDKVTVSGQAFEVVGAPWPVRHPRTGAAHHVEVNLRRTAAAPDA